MKNFFYIFGLFCMPTLLGKNMRSMVEIYLHPVLGGAYLKIIKMLESVFHTWFSVFPPNFTQVEAHACYQR